MEFGGGLGRFSISPPIKNKCREIVEVPGGPEWKIRKLQEEFDEFCWKYPGSSVIVYYHLKRLQTCVTPEDESQKLFYAKVSHFMSPVEIALQPKYLSSARKSIMDQLNVTYNFEKTVPNFFEDHQIFVSVACAVQELGIWYRGKIAQISGAEHVVVELVDFGTQILVPRHHTRPLIRRFGRAPPLCLKCRADGITINDLEIKDLHDFKNIILDCNALFRVEIKSLEEPFLIDLYHPTISGFNVCQKFFPLPEDDGKLDRIARSWNAHCKKMNEEFHEDDEDFKEEHGDGDYFPSFHPTTVIPDHQTIVQKSQKFISRLPKCARAPRFEQDTLLIDHIENAQLVYLQYPWQVSKRSKIDDFLRATWQNLPKIPEKFRQKDKICAIRNPRIDFVCRAVIVDKTTVLLVDYGRFVKCHEHADLRLIPAEEALMVEEPMITVVSLTRASNNLCPHHSETQFLRQKLPRGTSVHFKWDKKSKTTPMKGRLLIDGCREAINEQMVNYLKHLKIDPYCRQLDIYRQYKNHELPRGNHIYHATCHPHYSRGQEEFLWI